MRRARFRATNTAQPRWPAWLGCDLPLSLFSFLTLTPTSESVSLVYDMKGPLRLQCCSLGDILVDFLVSWGHGVLECGACLGDDVKMKLGQ